VSLTFVVGNAADVFPPDFAREVEGELRKRFELGSSSEDAYRSDDLEAVGWPALQQRAVNALGVGGASQIAAVDAYQAVYLPGASGPVEHIAVANAADPLQVGSVAKLVEELNALAAKTKLPTDDIELMDLAAHYLEDDAKFDQDLDVQTYIQLMLSAKQAVARKQPLWVVT
jgi:hypothetical protein